MHARIIVSYFVERMKIWTIALNVEHRGTSIERMVVMMERTTSMRERRGCFQTAADVCKQEGGEVVALT